MERLTAQDRLDRILAERAGVQRPSHPNTEFSYEAVRRKLAVLIQEKRFLIFALLKSAPSQGLTQQEIAATIGTGVDRFEFHLSTLCRERILLLKRDDNHIARFRINPAFASAAGFFLAMDQSSTPPA